MLTTAQIRPPQAPRQPEPLDELVPLVESVPAYGPPAVFLLGPWLLFVLMLAGPFALAVTLVVAMVVAAAALAALAAAIAAVVAAPYRLVRHLQRRRASRRAVGAPAVSAPVARPVAVNSPRVAA
jgi:hypothetical protein